METITELMWTPCSPADEGLYLFKKTHEWPLRLGEVKTGRWQNKQNPAELYIEETSILDLDGIWYGPIPKP